MPVRKLLHGLLRDLSSDEESVVGEAIVQASELLAQEHSYWSYERVLQRKSWLKRLPAGYAEARPASIRQTYENALPEELLGLRLDADEVDAIVAALLELLDRPV